jgi:aldose 1-epimerase
VTTRETYGTMPNGQTVEAYTLKNAQGVSVRILTYGGIIHSVMAPDREGALANVTLGLPDLATYLTARGHLGTLVGRFANRIAGGRFVLDGRTYELPKNNGENTLHGGPRGFDKAVWLVDDADDAHLALRHVSPNGDQGFPGNMTVRIRYSLTEESALRIDYEAVTDAPTVVNLTNHAYWNLADRGDILDHELQVNADAFTPMNDQSIPTGEIRAVEGTPFDFRKPARLRERVQDAADPQIKSVGGIDHNYVLKHRMPAYLVHAATLSDETSGRALEVWTTEPGMQVYTGNGLGNAPFPRWGGIALETQHFPNSPNEPSFPSTVLRPGETFRSSTEFVLKTR